MEVNNELSERELYDYKIACKAIHGDKKAYEEFFKKHKKAVYCVLLKIIGSESDANTLKLKVLEKSFSCLSEYPIQLPFRTWLLKITVELAIEFLKKKENV